MSSSRTKLVSTRLTDEEYAAVERAAGADTISAWARATLVQAATPPRATSTERNARGTSVELDWNGRPPRRHDEDRRDVVLRPDDRAAAAGPSPAAHGASRVEWRASSTAQWSGNPGRAPRVMLTRSAAWLPTMLVLACLSAGGIAAYRYARIWTPLQRQYLWSYVWSAVAISRSGSYELLVIVDQTTRRTALDADVAPVAPTAGGETLALTATAVSRGPVSLAWQRGEWDHAALHAFLRQRVYQEQTLRDLAQPPLWGAVAVLLAALVPVCSDEIASALITRATRSAWGR